MTDFLFSILPDGVEGKSEAVGGFSGCHAFSVNVDVYSAASITRLYGWRSPAAVVALVVAFCFDAVEGMPRRALPHVGKKQAEVISPAVRHGNASPTILRVMHRFGIVASHLGRHPRAIFAGARSAMRSLACAQLCAVQTSAAASIAVAKFATANNAACAAIAVAKPCRLFLASNASPLADSQLTESLAGQVNEKAHD